MADQPEADGDGALHFRQWTFLLVDDNPAALAILRSMLLMLGAKPPLEAMDAATAMDLVRQNVLDCIITDVRMEPLSGADLVRWVRRSNEAASPAVRILAMSAYRDRREIATVAREGANGFVGKPLSVPLLRGALLGIAAGTGGFAEWLPRVDGRATPAPPQGGNMN